MKGGVLGKLPEHADSCRKHGRFCEVDKYAFPGSVPDWVLGYFCALTPATV
jgi:hypothetical protein